MTGFKGIRNEKGRPKGAVNKTTQETKEILKNIVSVEIENINGLLDKLEPKERLDVIIKLLPYILPKQNEIAVENKTTVEPVTFVCKRDPIEIHFE